MCDICERASVDKGRSVFRCLNQVRIHGIEKKSHDRAGYSHILDPERLVVESVSEKYIVNPASEVVQIL